MTQQQIGATGRCPKADDLRVSAKAVDWSLECLKLHIGPVDVEFLDLIKAVPEVQFI